MLEQEVALRAERETRDRGLRSEESLVVAVVADAVGPAGVVVHEAEIVARACEDFGHTSEGIEALGEWSRAAGVAVGGNRVACATVEEGAAGGEGGGCVDAENGGAG